MTAGGIRISNSLSGRYARDDVFLSPCGCWIFFSPLTLVGHDGTLQMNHEGPKISHESAVQKEIDDTSMSQLTGWHSVRGTVPHLGELGTNKTWTPFL